MASTARENILKKIKQALGQPVPLPFPASVGNESVFLPSMQELEIEFAENFSKLEGRFSFCSDEKELAAQLQTLRSLRKWTKWYSRETGIQDMLSNAGFTPVYTDELATCDAAITGCEALIARTGSMVLSSAQLSGRTTSVYAPVHICIAYSKQLVYDIGEGLQQLREAYGPQFPSLVTLATGPSRTADIEKTLVVGVHGPKEVFCFLVDS
ncbi:MAG: LUD domain-containing protein [Chitinophagaceae bacterium]|nr:LUD domain-containing protein [Chitinophagaceae bacterium]MDP1762347.1 LUD domain-containing protein [Sediminibacterium sp.]MDP1810675.1 LUD domain-containing protein [Sediminibacterium sp.]MDP3129376.1 LUD domain-containing protein [Sediminibacterium sp.]MDP3666463.1 LUD domain-containing protein [Sediminibacterium sp.]